MAGSRKSRSLRFCRSRRPARRPPMVCRKHGISGATFYKWKAKFGGLEVSDAKRLRTLEDENAKLKKLLAEAMLDGKRPVSRPCLTRQDRCSGAGWFIEMRQPH